jgi:hypothetical protein
VFTLLLPSPSPPPRSIRIIHLAENVRENLGAQWFAGKILSHKHLALVVLVNDPARKFQDFRAKRLESMEIGRGNEQLSHFGKLVWGKRLAGRDPVER